MRGKERNGEWKRKNKKNEARKKECKRQGQTNITNAGRQKNLLGKKKGNIGKESCELRDARLEHMRTLQQQHLEVETPEQRDARLECMRQRLEAETPEQRDARLEHMKTLQLQRLEVETPEQRDARLECMGQRLEAESPGQTDARLEHMRTLQQQRLEVETPEQRDARLELMKTLQQQCLEVETPQERDTRLNLSQQTKSAQSDISKKMCAPQIDQGYVKGKMNRFHTEMLSIESLLCTTCLEKFPGTKMSVKSPECLRCCRDNKVPKLYSASNNMSPGFVPVELQVSLYIGKLHIILKVYVFITFRLPFLFFLLAIAPPYMII